MGDRIGYGWLPGEGSPLQRHRLNLKANGFFRNQDRSLPSLRTALEWTLNAENRHEATVRATRRTEDLREPFDLASADSIPTGHYRFYTGELQYSTPPGGTVSSEFRVTAGEFTTADEEVPRRTSPGMPPDTPA